MESAPHLEIPDAQQVAPAIDWSAALDRHDRWLRTVIVARLGGRDGVDEVFQEVALAAVRQSAPITDPTKVAPWLYRLAVVQSLLYRRSMGRRRKLINGFAREGFAASGEPSGDPLAWLLSDERRRLVREAIERLPPRDAEILLLKYTEDWSYHQLAEHLGISHSAVETRLHRARARLRAELLAMNFTEAKY